ncbi:RagB/SusD family nutrient uptake outer membrane protein [Mucilaginibacter auburnensis]|uniref:Putative outer membrane starch-binding protein n=1 Tax=Mucilaginibacter auburnensis TaxID=1457233 RepID=A0A2H9VLP4_9SPHI|nr:RagB/SusD family nutrient uptake outer membrane protein [Mucilaginibacter auburnensis]PJJ79241.1 putative outer membrane starch-binding protein [Mucilaginibacter auburnensis]
MKKIAILILLITVFSAGCKKDLIDPANENLRGKDIIYNEPGFAAGLLTNGYLRLPYDDFVYGFNDVATDDAVSNDPTNVFYALATGQWRKDNNAMDFWTRGHNAILYLNLILAEADKVKWAEEEQASKLFKMRIKGEAHGLRAIFMYFLLQAHGGKVGGKLMGLPILSKPSEEITDYNLPRAEYKEYVDFIYKDMQAAEDMLPTDYNDLNVNTGVIPAKYAAQGITSIASYNRVMGMFFRGRVNGRIVKAFRSRVSLMAASPAFLNGEGDSWQKAALAAADLINLNNGIAGLPANGWTFYNNSSEISAIANGSNPPEIIWRGRTLTHSNISSTIEKQHFPPSLFGNGRLNPTQNLVDAFPMKNGYPIDDLNGNYDKNNPYKDRDPRMDAYITVNGSKAGVSNTTISTTSGNDGVGVLATSTVTGYYMRKLLNQATNLNPATPQTKMMYVARLRYTEIYLNYAEAANEAYGPDGAAPGAAYTPRNVIAAIRKRAGVGGSADPYLASISSKEAMRELIRNERRLELCFEGNRFWDIRRWKLDLTKLNEPIRGIAGKNASGQTVYDFTGPFAIESQKRAFQSYMYYGPIPYFETLKFSNLPQNEGW